MGGWFDKINNKTISAFKKAYQGVRAPTIGGDPEFFIVGRNKKVTNADAYLPGKNDPIEIKPISDDDGKISKIYFDGIQAEIAVGWDTCRDALITTMSKCLHAVAARIPADHTLYMLPAAKVQKSVINRADPEARIFGCMPDFNAYTMSVNTPPMNAENHPYRYAGGHIHLGKSKRYDNMSTEAIMATTPEGHMAMVKWMDLMVSVPTFFFDNDKMSKIRREKYGKAGCFRPTPYGIEYRTPSCWWLQSPITMSLIFGLARTAWEMAVSSGSLRAPTYREIMLKQLKMSEEDIRGALDESDIKEISKIWEAIRPYLLMFGNGGERNPLNINCMIGQGPCRDGGLFSDFDIDPSEMLGVRDKDLLNNRFSIISNRRPVYSFAVFEYLRRVGVAAITRSDPLKEWGVRSPCRSPKHYQAGTARGFMSLSYNRLKENKDFSKFQASLLKEAFPFLSIV